MAAIQLKDDVKRTKLVLTEQGAFLDGFDNGAQREAGTRDLLEALGASLRPAVMR